MARGDGPAGTVLWKLLAAGAGVAAGLGARKLLTAGWRGAAGSEPPQPESPASPLPRARGWAAVSGAAIGLARIVAKRGAAAGWRKATGQLPPGVDAT